MSDALGDIYRKDFLDVVRVENINPRIPQPKGTQNSTYFYFRKYYISVDEDMWYVWICPEFMGLSAFEINRFYSLCWYIEHFYPELSSHNFPYRVSIDTSRLNEEEKKSLAANIFTTLYHPAEDNQHWKKFNSMRDYTRFVFGGEILTNETSTTVFYLDDSRRNIGFGSVYGPVLLGDSPVVRPIYVSTLPSVSFPQALQHFSDDELFTLSQKDDVWIDDKGVHVYVPQGDSDLSVAKAIRKVTSMRFITRKDRHDVISYPDKIGGEPYRAQVEKEMRFSTTRYTHLMPERYVQPYNSGMDYQSAITATKGVFRK